MKYLTFLALLLISANSNAEVSVVNDAKITKIEFYGAQFTVHLDKAHTSGSCGGSLQVVAMDATSEIGKAHMSALLSAWLGKKSVYIRVSDLSGKCYGDRPTIVNWSAY